MQQNRYDLIAMAIRKSCQNSKLMIAVVKKLMQLLCMTMSKHGHGTILECSNDNASTKIPTSVLSPDVFERVE